MISYLPIISQIFNILSREAKKTPLRSILTQTWSPLLLPGKTIISDIHYYSLILFIIRTIFPARLSPPYKLFQNIDFYKSHPRILTPHKFPKLWPSFRAACGCQHSSISVICRVSSSQRYHPIQFFPSRWPLSSLSQLEPQCHASQTCSQFILYRIWSQWRQPFI